MLVIEANSPGGQAGSSSRIENYLGFPTGISGQELATRAYAQAQKFGAEVLVAGGAAQLACDRRPYALRIDDGPRVPARAVVIATGAQYRKPSLDNLSQFEGAGVYYDATFMEAQLCGGEEVIVVGGGNSAGQAAVFLAQDARRVHMLVRSGGLAETMSRYLIRRIQEIPTIDLTTNTEIVALEGSDQGRPRAAGHAAGDVGAHDLAARVLRLLGTAGRLARAALRVRPPLLRRGARRGPGPVPAAVPAVGGAPPSRACSCTVNAVVAPTAEEARGSPCPASPLDGRAAHRASRCGRAAARRGRRGGGALVPPRTAALAQDMLQRWVVGTPREAAARLADPRGRTRCRRGDGQPRRRGVLRQPAHRAPRARRRCGCSRAPWPSCTGWLGTVGALRPALRPRPQATRGETCGRPVESGSPRASSW